ncbi:unnamed protein product [Paramecium sonneborni]|uniref:Zinc finger protein n=1 Tax=Paramecium sonneborni TaxID=65129 RepID=A0A8S1MFD9_9CILI|nr:unnamed protein product [Paramecium sonneborni]
MLDYSIGKRCNYSICKQQDFLPFTCQLCNCAFCSEHRTPEAHECSKQTIKKQAIICPICNKGISYTSEQNENIIWEQHFLKECTQQPQEKKLCSICNIKLTSLNSVQCKDCGLIVCLKHRQKEDHKCPTLLWTERKQYKNIPETQNIQKPKIQDISNNNQHQQISKQQQPQQDNGLEICPICGKSFPYIMQLIRHSEIHNS